ncbi:hypothetical protein VP01_1004g3 [Puccinia sorghi]|uniref:Uncharacterized protein n=1 Tax=Puccinia sorghi TaxID=27349 RepID=A0A0L6VWM8_9BASI|nr:hypothetical protein VP01_1004g3 [Puccinia sorghi]
MLAKNKTVARLPKNHLIQECEAYISFPMRDFALFSGGASIIKSLMPLTWSPIVVLDCAAPSMEQWQQLQFNSQGLFESRGSLQEGEGTLLLNYSIDSPIYIQEFPVSQNTMQHFSQVLIKIKSKHGKPNVYQFLVFDDQVCVSKQAIGSSDKTRDSKHLTIKCV